MPPTLKGDVCVWSMVAWNMFCLLKVRLFHYTPSIIQWCKHPLSITFCQMPFTERANGRKRDRRRGRINARGREKTDDNQRERQMEWGRERHWVRVKYPDWEVWRFAEYPVLWGSEGEFVWAAQDTGGVHLDRLIPNTVHNISLPVLCGTGSPFHHRRSSLHLELHLKSERCVY